MIPPAVVDIAVREAGKRGFRLWLPLFLLWPIILVVVLAAMLVSVAVDSILFIAGRRYHHYTLLLFQLGETVSRIRGTRVNVSGDTTVRVVIF